MNYPDVIADLRRRGDQFHAAANEIERLSDAAAPALKTLGPQGTKGSNKRVKRLKGRLTGASGTGAIVLDLLKDGPKSLAEVTAAAKVKSSSARTALLALEESGRVTREGKSRSTKYRLAKK